MVRYLVFSIHFLVAFANHYAEEIEDQDLFAELRDWIQRFLKYARDMVTFYDMYTQYRDVWTKFPTMIWALSHRRYVSFISRCSTLS